MLWDDELVHCALDVLVTEAPVSCEPSVAITYKLDNERSLWLKIIDLELCDRPSLSSLLSNISFTRKLATPLTALEPSLIEQHQPDKPEFLSLPISVDLQQHFLTLSYPLSPFGSASDLLHRYEDCGLPEAVVAAVVSRALVCLDNLHSRGVLHRNLCAQHLLLTTTPLGVLLCGLGSVCQFPPRGFDVGRNDLPPVYFAWRGWNTRTSTDIYRHPLSFYAPEVVVQDFTGYSWPADIYSFGLVIAELYNGQTPFSGLKPTEILIAKLCGNTPPKLQQANPNRPAPSQAMLDVYNSCMEFNASDRPTTKALLQTKWIRWGLDLEIDYANLEYYAKLTPPGG